MKRIFYVSGSVITGDRTAAAVLAYAQALAQRETSDTIDVPVIDESGLVGRAQFLVGPASQLMVVSHQGPEHDIDDAATIEHISQRIRGLLSPEGQPLDEQKPRPGAEPGEMLNGS